MTISMATMMTCAVGVDHDRLAGGAGDDAIQGGGGRNLIYFPGATQGVVVELTDPAMGVPPMVWVERMS